MFGAVGLWGLGYVLACLGLNLTLGGSHAASVTEGLDILFTCLAGLGRGTPCGGIRLLGHDTVAVAWGLAEAGSAGDHAGCTCVLGCSERRKAESSAVAFPFRKALSKGRERSPKGPFHIIRHEQRAYKHRRAHVHLLGEGRPQGSNA